MNKLLMRELGFNKEVDRIEKGLCAWCSSLILLLPEYSEFRDERSKNEYRISGLCQKCQDGFYQVWK